MSPQEDPRKAIVEVMARLSRETQLHMDERRKYIKKTDKVTVRISILIIILAVFNVYFVLILSNNMEGIVDNMDSMQHNLIKVDNDMSQIADTVEAYDNHLDYLHVISNNIGLFANNMPLVRRNMDSMTYSMQAIDSDMDGMKRAINNIGYNMHEITGNVSGMEYNIRQFSRPMGIMNPVFP